MSSPARTFSAQFLAPRLAPCWVLLAAFLLDSSAQAQVPLFESQAGAGAMGAALAATEAQFLVGVPFDDPGQPDAGSAYLFDAATGAQLHHLVPSDSAANQRFGYRADLSATHALVGAPFDATAGPASGAAYLFDPATGIQLHKLQPPVPEPGAQFGQSVALGPGRALVGAIASSLHAPSAGAAFLFDTTTGAHLLTLTSPDSAPGDHFGNALAIQGPHLFIAARAHNQSGTASGTVYVFDATTGALLQELAPLDGAPDQTFGASISATATYLAIGAIQDDSQAQNAGAAYLFDRQTFTQLHKLLPQTPDPGALFGQGLSLSGERLLIGASHQSNNDGAAYLFDAASGAQLYSYRAPSAAPGSQFGVTTALSPTRAHIAAPGHNGTGIVFTLHPSPALGSPTCSGVPNSTGTPATLSAAGSPNPADNDLTLIAGSLPPGQFAYLLASPTQGFIPNPGGSQGNLCLAAPIARFTAQLAPASASGLHSTSVDTQAIPLSPAAPILPGESWHFQLWHRDMNPGPTSNFTPGLVLDFP